MRQAVPVLTRPGGVGSPHRPGPPEDAARASRPLPGSVWLLGAAWVLSATADNFLLFLLLWIAKPLGWSGLEVGLLVLLLRLPALAGGWTLGRVVDRYGGRPVMLGDLLVRTGLMTVLGVTGGAGGSLLTAVLLLGPLTGFLAPATYTGSRWMLPRLVPDALLPRANAVLSVGDQLPLLLGAAAVAPAIALLGPAWSCLIPGVLLLAAAVLVASARTPSDPARHAGPRIPDQPRAAAPRRVVAVITLSVAYYFAYGPFEVAVPAYVRERLHGSEATYGALWVAFGIGSLVTLPLAPYLAGRRPGVVNAAGAALWGLATLPLVAVTDAWAAMLVFAVSGAVWGPYAAVEATALHRWLDPPRHGRYFGRQRALLQTAAPAGAAIGAALIGKLGPVTIMAGSLAACVLAGVAALAVPQLRSAR